MIREILSDPWISYRRRSAEVIYIEVASLIKTLASLSHIWTIRVIYLG